MAEGSRRPWHPPAFVKLSAGIHAASLGTLAFAPEHWAAALGGLALNQAVLSTAGMWPRSRLLGANLLRLPASTARAVALTFDDGPHPEVTPRVLDVLDRHQARATFFVVGRKVEAHPELAREIQRAGTRSRTTPTATATGSRSSGLGACSGRSKPPRTPSNRPPAAGRRCSARPPESATPGSTRPGSDRLGLVSWTRRGFDTVTRDPRRVAGRLVRGLRAGDILLLHDGSSAADTAGRPVVLEALPRVLDALSARQLGCVPVCMEDVAIPATAPRSAPGYGT